MKNHVTNLELSKRLKELGFPQESLIHHVYEWDLNEQRTGEIVVESIGVIEHCEMEKNIIYSAYLATELGEFIIFWKVRQLSEETFEADCLELDKQKYQSDKITPMFLDATPQDSMAKMLIYLAENDLLDVNNL